MIELTTSIHKETGEELKKALNGATYADLDVINAPVNGMFVVSVQSLNGVSDEELTGLVIDLMAQKLATVVLYI